MSNKLNSIYTHDEAAKIVEFFEDILCRYKIKVPSPEDDEREPDNEAALYGSVYSELMDNIENNLIDLLDKHDNTSKIINGEFSGLW